MEHLEIHGERIPAIGFGTARLREEEGVESVRHALETGYRHIDTAQMYRNESEVGEGIRRSGVPREEIFLTTKIVGESLAGDRVGPATDQSLKALGTDYIDLLLIHAPSEEVPLTETLDAMVAQKEAGKIRHIGVSNFRGPQLREAMEHTEIFTDQVPYSPGRTQRTLCEIARTEDVLITAYSPLRGPAVDDPALREIGRAHGKSPQQVALRWLLQQPNVSPIPRSASPQNRRSNLDVFDFELSSEEMERIHSLAQSQAG